MFRATPIGLRGNGSWQIQYSSILPPVFSVRRVAGLEEIQARTAACLPPASALPLFVGFPLALDRLHAEFFADGVFEFVGLEALRTTAACVGDQAFLVDEIEAIGDAAIGLAYLVVDLVDHGGHREFEFCNAGLGYLLPFLVVDRIFDLDLAHGPGAVDGVRFVNVDEQELNVLLVLLVELSQPTG